MLCLIVHSSMNLAGIAEKKYLIQLCLQVCIFFFNNEWRKVTYLVICSFNLNALILFYIEKVYMVPLLVQMKNKIKKHNCFMLHFSAWRSYQMHRITERLIDTQYMNCVHVPPIFFLVRCFQYLLKKNTYWKNIDLDFRIHST